MHGGRRISFSLRRAYRDRWYILHLIQLLVDLFIVFVIFDELHYERSVREAEELSVLQGAIMVYECGVTRNLQPLHSRLSPYGSAIDPPVARNKRLNISPKNR